MKHGIVVAIATTIILLVFLWVTEWFLLWLPKGYRGWALVVDAALIGTVARWRPSRRQPQRYPVAIILRTACIVGWGLGALNCQLIGIGESIERSLFIWVPIIYIGLFRSRTIAASARRNAVDSHPMDTLAIGACALLLLGSDWHQAPFGTNVFLGFLFLGSMTGLCVPGIRPIPSPRVINE